MGGTFRGLWDTRFVSTDKPKQQKAGLIGPSPGPKSQIQLSDPDDLRDV